MAEIKKTIRENLEGQETLFDNFDKQIETLIRQELKKDKESLITKTQKNTYKLKPTKPSPEDPTKQIDKLFEGAAGEAAVIAELLFHEFNANRMMVDKGIDVVATKDNVYRYIQVKTSNIKEGRIHWQIKQERFDAYVVNNLRYILVARYEEKFKYKNESVTRSMFFVLSSNDIDRGINQGWINKGIESLSIKVKFDTQTGAPKFYNDKEADATYYLNNFDLV
jgi:phage host-nuclease inhibitor protein Gam